MDNVYTDYYREFPWDVRLKYGKSCSISNCTRVTRKSNRSSMGNNCIYACTHCIFTIFGKLGDIFPKNKVYSAGFLIFAIGAILNSTTDNFFTLLAFRCIEASGASIMIANGPAVIATLFHGEARGKALGINACIVAIGGMSGPAVGGFLINTFDWHAIFLPSVPIALIGAYLSYKLLPKFTKKNNSNLITEVLYIFQSHYLRYYLQSQKDTHGVGNL